MARSIGTGGRYATLPITVEFDGEDFMALSRDLYGAAELLKKEAGPVLEEIGTKIMEDAKQIAGQHSSRIPGTIRGRLLNGLAYEILAGSASVPEALLFELGNKGSGPDDPTFTHPVYGTSAEVTQARHPFLRPALKKNRYFMRKALYQMWNRVLIPYRLKAEHDAGEAE